MIEYNRLLKECKDLEYQLLLLESDLSGNYESSSEFILTNNLEDRFIEEYGEFDIDEYYDIDEYIRDIGDDETVIADLLSNDYRLYYDESSDEFIISLKNKTNNIDFEIKETNEQAVVDIINEFVYTEYYPRFGIYVDDTLVGGSTYYIDDENQYWFDVAVKEEYHGYGFIKELMRYIIDDSKNCDLLIAEVVNRELEEYLKSIGFHVDRNKDRTYLYK